MGAEERTNVIVVGAGASKEFSLPTGAELLEKIEKLADLGFESGSKFFGEHHVFDAFRQLSINRGVHHNEYLRAARFLKKNMSIAPSIDNFLHTHKDNNILVDVGKILIAKSISEAERQSTIYFDPRGEYRGIRFSYLRSKGELKPNWSWLGELFRLLASGRNLEDFINALKNITFISFNYDRCIAQFLLSAASQYFDCTHEELKSVQEAILIVHPYGSLGQLKIVENRVDGFGSQLNGERLCEAISGLKTFTEGLAVEKAEQEIRDSFQTCDVAIFLGFGYLPLNLHRLFGSESYSLKRVLGTTKGMSEESTSMLRDELVQALLLGFAEPETRSLHFESAKKSVSLADVTCSELFRMHNRFLTLNR